MKITHKEIEFSTTEDIVYDAVKASYMQMLIELSALSSVEWHHVDVYPMPMDRVCAETKIRDRNTKPYFFPGMRGIVRRKVEMNFCFSKEGSPHFLSDAEFNSAFDRVADEA